MLYLPRGERAARAQAVARLPVYPHDHGRSGERSERATPATPTRAPRTRGTRTSRRRRLPRARRRAASTGRCATTRRATRQVGRLVPRGPAARRCGQEGQYGLGAGVRVLPDVSRRQFRRGSANVSCFLCHGSPHAPAPWRGAPYTHTDTDPSNAPVCAQCHRSASAPAGTAPGCFNNTLCHASPVPHPVDNAWVTTAPAAQPHGNSAKAAPGGTTGFSDRQGCHGTGTNFAGGTSLVSCYPCHRNVDADPSNWVGGGTYTHRTTNSGNATVCAFCHLNGANSPIARRVRPPRRGRRSVASTTPLCHN